MQNVNYTYKKSNLEALFDKEEELLGKITPFCNETEKEIEVNYYFTKDPSISFILEIIIKDDEEKS
jgi:hypothetical protein